MPLEAVENWRRAVVHQQALPVSPPQVRPSKRSSAQSALPPVVPPKVDRSLSLSSSSSSALPSDAWSTASLYGGERGTPSHALCAFRTGGTRCICRAASLGSTDADNSDLPSTSDEERRRKSASSATTVNDHPGTGGGKNMDPYHAKHCDTTGTADLGARRSGGSKYSGSKPGSKRSSGAGQSQVQGQGHIRSPSGGGSSHLQPKPSTPVPFPSNVASPNPSSTSKNQKRVSAPAPSRPQAHDYAIPATHTPTPNYTTATNTPYGSLGRSATTGSAYHRSQPRTRGSPNPNITPTPAQGQQGLGYDSLRSNATYTSSQNAFDSLRTPTSLYDPLSPPSTMPRPSRLPGGRQSRPLNSLWDAAQVDNEVATTTKGQGQAPNRVFNYYTTPSGGYRKPTALVTSPRPNASANATPRQHDLDDQHSPTSADFSSGPIPQAQVGLGFGGSIPNGHTYVHPYVHAPGGPAHPQASGYAGPTYGPTGSTASASTSPQSGHSQSGGLSPGSPEHTRAPSWISASTGWSRGRGRRRAPSDPSSTSGRATSTGPPVRPPLSTTGSSTFSTWTLVSPPPPSPVRPAPILLHPSRSAGSNTSRGGHSSRGHGHSQSVGGGQLRASTETNGSSTAVGSGSSGSKHGHGNGGQGGAGLSRVNSRTESFRRVRRNSLKAIGKFVNAVADAFGRLPSGQGEGGVRSPRVA